MQQILNSNYYIDKEGNIYNKKRKKLKINIDHKGKFIKINIEGIRKTYPIWKLMKMAYFKDIKENEVIEIIDNDLNNTKLNNYKIVDLNRLGKRIKNFTEYIITKDGKVYTVKNDRLQQMKTYYGINGYESIKLSQNNKTIHKLIHRLVAEAFIENPYNKEEIDHIDANIKNNNYKNLRWVTRKENLNYALKRHSPIRNFKKCILINDNGLYKEFNSKKECCEYARDNFNCSYSSLMKYNKFKNYKLIKESLTTIENTSMREIR